MSVSAADLNTAYMSSRGLQLATGHRQRGRWTTALTLYKGLPGNQAQKPNRRMVHMCVMETDAFPVFPVFPVSWNLTD